MSSTSNSTTDQGPRRSRGSCCGPRSGTSNWSGPNVAALVAGFVIFWPIGLFVLLWSVAGRDVRELPDAIRRLWESVAGAWRGHDVRAPHGATDNTVFNEFQQAQHERIREIRDEIRDRARRFGEFRARARRRADEEEFNQFMADGPLRGDG